MCTLQPRNSAHAVLEKKKTVYRKHSTIHAVLTNKTRKKKKKKNSMQAVWERKKEPQETHPPPSSLPLSTFPSLSRHLGTKELDRTGHNKESRLRAGKRRSEQVSHFLPLQRVRHGVRSKAFAQSNQSFALLRGFFMVVWELEV